MSTAAKLTTAVSTKWTIQSGPGKGNVRLMNSVMFYMGRSTDCEFLLPNDPKVSRQHAKVECIANVCEIMSLSDKNPVKVNGREIERAALRDGDVVTVGDTEIRFSMVSPAPTQALGPASAQRNNLQAVPPTGMVNPMPKPQAAPRPQTPSRPASRKSAGSNRLLLYGGVGLLLWFLLSPSNVKKKEQQIRTEQQIQADIEAANRLREASESENLRRGDQNVIARQAQENYVRGFRDYKKGQYERAVLSFQSCLALSPEHPLCNHYVRVSQRKFNELVQYQMVLGRKYRDQNQYNACRASFRNVMVMVKDANNPAYKEAKANFDACSALVEGRY